MKKDINFKQTIAEIDEIFQETLEKLNDLHNQKIALIEKYLKSAAGAELEKARKNLPKA